MSPARRSLVRDRAAQGAADAFLILLIILVPLVLFVALFVYLRRTAPGGEVTATTNPVDAAPAPAGALEGSKTCTRCGFVVKAHRLRQGTQCPNCGSGLPA